MKKLLSVLGSLAISAMTVATVIACSTLSYDTEEPENLQQLLDEISIKINNDMQYWFKQNGEVFFANQKDLDFLRTKYNNAEGEFPVYILSTDLPETFNKFMQAAKNKFYDLGKELLYSAKFGHLFTGLEPSQIIDVLEWKELKLNDFDIVKKVNEHSSQEGYSEMALKADSIADSFQISGKFKVIFNFVIGDQKNTHVTPSNFFNTYLTNDVITFHEVSNWIKKRLP
ncbi:lipoprotein [Spiroplasma endosymbiont of Anurida maritima]|uniref:lipoprotein n=1 Tax=Spiroplasma endosymbiont of Anurida maritima TaxID=2967972 RepID=UPI0036D293BE